VQKFKESLVLEVPDLYKWQDVIIRIAGLRSCRFWNKGRQDKFITLGYLFPSEADNGV
jgi:hypothetical protein